ncbi:PadR family transcriptional regulator [Mangrovactinospora gilvigrisea]|uniref:PadR family transcriptional regulator n=1 Tax=Mangrovactinospora gilvigrisea TaxID=1428644 RepID=A0A1J7BPX0_9ACTN|nr:PadR family transcriptional regulator [Mangrovactinospora gilvigrisea]OIV35497.1 PadR family transcriptional regulator [Mangrovactinospora gilvigrisea]
MPPVFGHGRLRLYLLKLLAEAPRHGYEVIRLLEERFQGLYAPSAGTVYPRLAKLEQEGLVTHTVDGGRKVYAITDAGRDELAARQDELAELESDIRDSLTELAADIREDVQGSAESLREEMHRAAKETGSGAGAGFGSKQEWRRTKQEWQRAKQEAKDQARRAKEEHRRAADEARRARHQAQWMRRQAQEEMGRVKQQLQDAARQGDWTAITETLSDLGRSFSTGWGGGPTAWEDATASEPSDTPPSDTPPFDAAAEDTPPEDLPDWARTDPDADPARELERLLDRFRDRLRDDARDSGVTAAQLARAAQLLASTAAHWRR